MDERDELGGLGLRLSGRCRICVNQICVNRICVNRIMWALLWGIIAWGGGLLRLKGIPTKDATHLADGGVLRHGARLSISPGRGALYDGERLIKTDRPRGHHRQSVREICGPCGDHGQLSTPLRRKAGLDG